MSVIEDSRKVVQDFIAPELRAIAVRMEALEKRFDGLDKKIDEVDRRAEQRSADAERRAEKRHDALQASIQQVINFNSLQERLAKLESKEAAHQ